MFRARSRLVTALPRAASVAAGTCLAAMTAVGLAVPAGAAPLRTGAIVHCYETDATGQIAGGHKGTVYDVDGQENVLPPAGIVTAQCTDFGFNEGSVTVTAVFVDGSTESHTLVSGETYSFFHALDVAGNLTVIKSLSFTVD